MQGVFRKLLSLRSLSFKEHFIYWVLPFSVTMIFLIMFCFGSHWMQEFVSPQINREYGAQEAMQAIILGVLVYVSIKCFLNSHDLSTRLIFVVAALISLFLLLEEIDYGRTYYELIFHVPPEDRAVVRSFHGQDTKRLIKMKDMMYLYIVIVFVLLPLIEGKWIPVFFRKFIPSAGIILSVAALEVVSLTSFFFVYDLRHHGNKSLDYNTTEFGENIIYYMLLLHMIELYHRLRMDAGKKSVRIHAKATEKV